MRDPKQLTQLYQTIAELHERSVPNWRIGQLMMNFMGWVMLQKKVDAFFTEDEQFVEWLKEFMEKKGGFYPYEERKND